MKKPLKTADLHIRLTASEKAAIEAAADADHRSPGDWARLALNAAARKEGE